MISVKNAICSPSRINFVQQRNLFAFLNFIFNRVSKSRIKEVGPDRACAEWLMRNGAFIKWKGYTDFVESYNSLPLDPKITGSYFITHVKAHDASINHQGFAHFYGCKEIVEMEFHKCVYFDDRCINQLSLVKNSLHSLKITACHEVTENGLRGLINLPLIRKIVLGNLEGVSDINKFSEEFSKANPICKLEILKNFDKPPDTSPSKLGLFSSQK